MEYSCFGMHIFFLVCNWAIIAMKHRCAKFTNSGFNKAAVCIFNMLDRTSFNLNFKCQCYNKRIAGDSYHWSDLVYLKPLTMLTRARNHFSRLHLHSAVCSLFVLFFFFLHFFPTTSHTSQLYIKECIFSVTPLCSWQVATAWEDSLSRRAAGAHVWLGCQWITLYGERKLKMQGCNLLESGTDLKALFFLLLAALLEVFQICHSWVWTELRCTGNSEPGKAASSLYLTPPPSPHYFLAKTGPC